MITIYHNPRCRKSREGLAVLEEAGVPYTLVKYLDNPLTSKQLKELIDKLGIKPIELVRTKESIWKEQYKGKTLSDTEIIQAMAKYPKLIERPIVVNGDKAVLGRPAEKIKEIL
jgi:arsenate reductase